MSPFLAFFIGALISGAILVLWFWRRRAADRNDQRQLVSLANIQSKILAAAPDGLFLWNYASDKQRCSRRLAILLDLTNGVDADFSDVSARFAGQARSSLTRAVSQLHQEGASFDMLLAVGQSQRMLQVTGVRSLAEDGRPIADMLWMRDANGTNEIHPRPDDTDEDEIAWAGLFKSFLDVLPFPVWLRDKNMKTLLANKSCAITGIASQLNELAIRAKASGQAECERHLSSAGDVTKMFEVTEVPLKGWEGTAGFAIDLTDSEKMAGEFARHDAARNQVLENLTSAIAIFGDDKRLKFYNSAYCQLWGLNKEWLDDKPGFNEILERLREQRRLPEVTDFHAFRDEQLSIFEMADKTHETLMHLPDGSSLRTVVSPHSLGGLVFVYEDVSDRLALERSYNTLSAVQRETIDNLYEGIAVFGSDGRMKLSNHVFAEMWHLPAEHLEESPHVSDFVERMSSFLSYDGDWATHKKRIISSMMSREVRAGRLMRVDGYILDYANVPLPDGAVLVNYLDVSDSARVEQALRQRADALQEANSLKSEFIANVSYELRTPLNTLMGFAEILNQEYFGELNSRQKEYSKGIVETSQGLMTVIASILDLASIEAGNISLEIDTVELHSMLVSVLSLVNERARHKGLKLEFDCPANIGWIVADEKRLKQALFNLLSNSVNFTPAQGTVRLEALRDNDNLILKVSDNGIGIPKADQEMVFMSFERGSVSQHGQGAGQGAGLGLSLVKRFIELHGGSVELVSAPKKGTCVICRIPALGGVD